MPVPIFSKREGKRTSSTHPRRQSGVEIFAPQRKPVMIATLAEGEILGWSWLLPPYQRKFHAHAIETVRAIALDGKCLRTKCEDNHDLGYEILKRFARSWNNVRGDNPSSWSTCTPWEMTTATSARSRATTMEPMMVDPIR